MLQCNSVIDKYSIQLKQYSTTVVGDVPTKRSSDRDLIIQHFQEIGSNWQWWSFLFATVLISRTNAYSQMGLMV